MNDDAVLLLTNAPDEATARRIARELVERKLAACVNVGAPAWSVYRWQGAVEEAVELPLQIKTTARRLAEAQQLVASLHPYDIPEMLVVTVGGGSPAYLAWIGQETRD